MNESRCQFSRRHLLSAGSTAIAAACAGTFGVSDTSAQSPQMASSRGAPRRIIKPPRLRPGDTIGLVDPASATWEPVDVAVVEESWAALGLKTKRGAHLLERRGYFAGSDDERAADLNAMLRDPDVRAVHCVRGGWGSARLLQRLDFTALERTPKAVIGFSDITALLLSCTARTGLVTFHGPNGASQWNPFNVGWLRRVLIDGEAVTFENIKELGDNLTQVDNRVQTITPGVARGRLLGGNLTVLTAIVGSSYLPDFNGAILFVEDVGEEPYRIDRMFTQLDLAGVLKQVRGVVWGTCQECDPGVGFGSLTITDVLSDHVKPLGIPAFQGAMIGHADRQFTLPVGLDVEVDAKAGTIRMLEPAVS
ncbi:MAG: LD-carboxypeptidase [Vicinamibacterales bacterium]